MTFIEMDMSSLHAVKDALKKFTHERLDILMCNAGIMAVPPALSKDGFEIQFAVNHLAHAMVIDQLLPVLQRTSDLPEADVRIICLSSEGHAGHPSGGFLFDKLRTPMDTFFGSWIRYGQSKLANVMYAAELARRFPKILSVSVHPGVVATELVTKLGPVRKSIVYGANFMMGASLMELEKEPTASSGLRAPRETKSSGGLLQADCRGWQVGQDSKQRAGGCRAVEMDAGRSGQYG